MRIQELLEGKKFDDLDFVTKENGKRSINFDLAEDLIHFMNQDDDVYRRHTYPAIANCLDKMSKKSKPNTKMFEPAVKESYKLSLEDFGLNSEFFDDTFGNLIAGDVSPSEFRARVGVTFEGIQNNIPQVKEFYSANYGIDLTDEAIFASALKPELGEQILNKQVAVSQIGGEARRAGFGAEISLSKARELQAAGVTQAQARQLFQQAQVQLPELQELQAQRGVSEEERFTLGEFTEAAIFCLLYTSPSPRDRQKSRMPSSA